MAVKLTKNEQKKQKDALKQFNRYLPTLQLKKQQLQLFIRQIEEQIRKYEAEQQKLIDSLDSWIAVFGENPLLGDKNILKLVQIDTIVKGKENVAGVEIPVFRDLTFKEVPYSLYDYPLWMDKGIVALKECSRYDAMIKTLKEQIELISKELRTTSQRVNLFEKVKIPEAKENIRVISIYLGDQDTSAVVRGKIAKKKLVKEA